MNDRPEGKGSGTPAAPAPRRARRWAGRIALGLLLLGALLAVRVAMGPVALPTADRFAYMILSDLAGPGGRVAVGSVGIAVEAGRGVVLVVDDLAITGPAGRLEAPRTRIDVSVRALLSGRLVGRSIDVEAPVLDLAPFSVGPAGGPGPVAGIETLDRRLDRLVRIARAHAFERFRIAGGTIVFPGTDPRLPAPALEAVDVAVAVAPDGDVDVALAGVSFGGPWRLSFERRGLPGGGSTLEAVGRNLAVVDLLPASGPLRRGFHLSPSLFARLDAAGSAERLSAGLTVGEGTMRFGRDPERTLDSLEVALDWAAGDPAFSLSSLTVVAGDTRVALAGRLTPPAPGRTAWSYSVKAVDTRLAPPDVPGPPLVLSDFRMEGTIDPATSTFAFTRGIAVAPQGVFRAAGAFEVTPDGPTFSGSAEIAATTVDTLKRIWPPVTAHDARSFLVNEVLGGVIERASANFALTPEDLDGLPETDFFVRDGMDVTVRFREGILRLPGELPALQRASGVARIRDREARLEAANAILPVDGREPVAVERFSAVVEDLALRPPPGRMAALVAGPAASVAAVAAAEPVNALDDVGIAPGALSGTIRADLSLSGPFDDPVDPDDLEWGVAATLENVATTEPVAGQTVTDADLEITANPRRFAIAGTALIDGIEASINYSEIVDGPGSGGAVVRLTDRVLKDRGWDLGGRVRGPIEVRVGQAEDGTERIEADLERALIAIPELGWTKARGEAATVSAVLDRGPERILVGDITLSAEAASGRAEIELDGEGGLRRASLESLALRPGDVISATLTPRDGGGFLAVLDADEIDGRRLLEAASGGGAEAGAGGSGGATARVPIDFRGTVGRLSGHGGMSLRNLSFEGRVREGRVSHLTGSGRLDGRRSTSPVDVRVTPIGRGVRKANLRLADAGDALGFLGVYNRMRGGTAAIDVAIGADGRMDGTLSARDFEIAGEPRLEEIIREARRSVRTSVTDPRPLAFQGGRGGVGGNDLAFEELTVDFLGEGDVVRVRDAVLRGAVVGGTAEGTIDLAEGTVDLAGTAIPAYAINNLFGRIPMIGEILGAGRSGGLIGITFRLAGALDDPRLSVNPISAVAPGILRKVFEFN